MSIGKIIRWQEDKGFGFIKSEDFDSDIFVHITAFPKGSVKPRIGDEVVFQVQNTPKGVQATKARYQNQQNTNTSNGINSTTFPLELERDTTVSPTQNRTNSPRANRRNTNERPSGGGLKGIMSSAFGILAIGAIGYYAYGDLSKRFSNQSSTPIQQISENSSNRIETSSQNFKCDGRQTCGQMTSKAEAQFFLANCPTVKMDGDGDGDACEQQFGH